MQGKTSFLTYLLFAVLFAVLAFQFFVAPNKINVSYTRFKALVNLGKIETVLITDATLTGIPPKPAGKKKPPAKATTYVTNRVGDNQLIDFLEAHKVTIIGRSSNTWLVTLLSWIVPIGLLIAFWAWFGRRLMKQSGGAGGLLNMGKSRAKIVVQRDVGVGFNDVAGLEEAKQELKEVLEFLKEPKKFTRLGAKIPKGILLVGPPGTGKTLLARAVAGESGVPFFSISGSDFIEMFVGLGAARVRDMFEQAKAMAPCVIFIDELDALGKARGLGGHVGSHDEQEQTLNQLLSEMDGFSPTLGVILLAATNRPEILDPALLRPGRFDRQILVDRPDLPERLAILQLHTKHIKLDPQLSLEVVARRSSGFTGADLANLVNEATLLAVRKNKETVDNEDFDQAMDRIMAGLEKKNRRLNEHEKEVVAYHESGHALIGALRGTADKLHKISIVPRGIAALGFTLQLPTEDRYLMSKRELLEKIDVLLGGRAAEELLFGDDITTGAHNDLEKASDIARSMIMTYGMSKSLGYRTFKRQSTAFLGQPDFSPDKSYSEATAQKIDEEVYELLEDRMRAVKSSLQRHRDSLSHLATALLERETIDADDFNKIVGPLEPEPFVPESKLIGNPSPKG